MPLSKLHDRASPRTAAGAGKTPRHMKTGRKTLPKAHARAIAAKGSSTATEPLPAP
jgi:hypothetical protein